MGLVQLDIHIQKKLNPFLIPYIKFNSNESKHLHVKAKAIKLLEENIGVNLHDFGLSKDFTYDIKSDTRGASLVAQWLRICLPMQGTRVRAPVCEDPTCHGATGPVSHNY